MSNYTGSVPDTEPGRAWLLQAACRNDGVDPEIFFHDNNAAYISAARTVCGACPVRRYCLIDCMRHEGGRSAKSRWGVYAGMTPRQRERLYHKLRNRSKARAKDAA
jgi:WhiB family redox-sensing transcriptional regulator